MVVKKYGQGSHRVRSYCRMCSYHCGIIVEVEDGIIKNISGDKEHPYNKGVLCIKGKNILNFINSPERLLKPLKKVNGKWEEIDLETALNEIALKIKQVTEEYRPESLGIWNGEALGSNQQRQVAHRFAFLLGTPNVFSNDTLCAVSKKAAIATVIGKYPAPDFENSKCIVVWGANPPASGFINYKNIVEARKKGAKVVLIDPRKTQFSRHADMHLQLRPATDGALALGLIKVLTENEWYHQSYIDRHTRGFFELVSYAKNFSMCDVEEETGIPREKIFELARLIAESSPAYTYMVGVGPEHHDNGFDNIRAIACLGVLCGSTDKKGGLFFPEKPELNSLLLEKGESLLDKKPLGAGKYPVFYDHKKEGHTLEAMEAILHGEPYPLKGMVLTGANPVLTNPNAAKVKKALSSLSLFVARDLFLTQTAELANYVLPATNFLERTEVLADPSMQRLYLREKIMEEPSGCQGEYQFWHSLAQRLELGEYFPWEDESELNKWLLEPSGISPEQLAGFPEGWEYKPIEYENFVKKGFSTPSGKIEFSSDYLFNYGYSKHPVYETPSYMKNKHGEYEFTLITGARQARFKHSCYFNISGLRKETHFPVVEMHPDDASKLGIKSGDIVRVDSKYGSLEIRASVLEPDGIKRGFLQITHGWPEANVNLLTTDEVIDPISGFPSVRSIPVKIK